MSGVYKRPNVVTPSTPPLSSLTRLALLGSSFATAALAVYQWFELLHLRAGGAVSCAVNSTVNCATVWSSPFASNLHEHLGMPIAGLGLVWALTAFGASVLATRQGLPAQLAAVKVLAVVGALSVVLFAGASYSVGALCLTCLGTYVLVGVYVVAAFAGLPKPVLPEGGVAMAGMGWSLALAAPVFLLMLYPGSKTPREASAPSETLSAAEVLEYLNDLPPRDAQLAAAARETWRRASVKDTAPYPQRSRLGPANAPVHIVDFTDILCTHCKHFEEGMARIRQVAPEGSISFEGRSFPLDAECNPLVTKNWGDGIRCAAARAQVCLEGSEQLWAVREELFARQKDLTKALVMEIASKAMPRAQLETCMASGETEKKLAEDRAYALLYGLQGTPLVILNGRDTLPSEAFILGMAVSKGDAEAPYFKKLPPPPSAAATP